MATTVDNDFINLINRHLGIANKVSRIYAEGEADKEDLMQEMMYQLWKSYPAFDNRSKFSTWMYRVCLNTALTYRKNQSNNKMESLADTHLLLGDESTDKEDGIRLLMLAISHLSSLNKAIILLYLEEMSYDEIAAITGLSKSNVSVRLVRIKKELEKNIKQHLTQ